MKGLRGIVLLLAVVASAGIQAEWYQGGTLHRGVGRQWKSATAQNRLATSADFVSKVAKPRSMEEMREKATGLSACISEAVADSSGDEQEVSAIAAACVVLLGYEQ
ncbi:hypothetical protein ACFJIW_09770 [Tahibacter sp. UC22_41]|uniref:hypothetical protein n=1 Tax=Tahibacter sp. UC22_41 TaxID=3350178 RepID=UPI0036DA1124